MKENIKNTCEACQQALSDAEETGYDLPSEMENHIRQCQECAEFQRLWSSPEGVLIDLACAPIPVAENSEKSSEKISANESAIMARILEGTAMTDEPSSPETSAFTISRVPLSSWVKLTTVAAALALIAVIWGLQQSAPTSSGDNIATSSPDIEDTVAQNPKPLKTPREIHWLNIEKKDIQKAFQSAQPTSRNLKFSLLGAIGSSLTSEMTPLLPQGIEWMKLLRTKKKS